MTKQRTNAAHKVRDQAISRTAAAGTMMAATSRANDPDRSKAYFYGNLGDSVERRNGGGDTLLGGGGFDGVGGTNSSWQAQGTGNYFGTGLLNGYGRMNSGIHGGGGGGYCQLGWYLWCIFG